MIMGFYNLDGMEHEYAIDGKRIFDPNTDKDIQRVWVYPVKQGVWGGTPVTLYFSTTAARAAYMADHDYCDKLPRCKVPRID